MSSGSEDGALLAAGSVPVVAPATSPCKVCGSTAGLRFGLPRSKRSGHPIPDEPDDCWYYECSQCKFLFTRGMDDVPQETIYDDTYWGTQDPNWYGRVPQTMRLIALAASLLQKPIDEADVLDFGCGSGGFVEIARRSLSLNAWGTDIIRPRLAEEYFLPDLGTRKFDIIVACEVIEHLPDPVETLRMVRSHLKWPGVFAFQTAEYNPHVCDRDWWYLGPDNGHISLYSRESLDLIFRSLGGVRRADWRGYKGVQAWLFP